MKETTPTPYVKVKEAADILMVTPWTVRRLLREGNFPGAVRPGRDYLIPREEIHDYFVKGYNEQA
jgi:excisionase family DNA binding protein